MQTELLDERRRRIQPGCSAGRVINTSIAIINFFILIASIVVIGTVQHVQNQVYYTCTDTTWSLLVQFMYCHFQILMSKFVTQPHPMSNFSSMSALSYGFDFIHQGRRKQSVWPMLHFLMLFHFRFLRKVDFF